MSKTAQRKRQAYEEGLRDGVNDNGFGYRRHPFMEAYRTGFQEGSDRLNAKRFAEGEGRRWYNRLLAWFARKVAV